MREPDISYLHFQNSQKRFNGSTHMNTHTHISYKEKRHLILTLHWFCNILYFHLYTFNQNTSQRMSVEKDFLQTCDFFIQEKTALQHSFTWSGIIPLNVYSISTVNTIMYRICILIHSYFIRKCIGSNKIFNPKDKNGLPRKVWN